MFPLFPFVAGVLTGAVALRLIKTDKTKAGLEKAQDTLRDATVSSLEAIEHASARARKRLAPSEVEEAAPVPEETVEAAKPAARKRAPRATKAAPAAGEEESAS
ncbi:MAG: hypothetical protein ACYC5W_12035 [Thauera sp.]